MSSFKVYFFSVGSMELAMFVPAIEVKRNAFTLHYPAPRARLSEKRQITTVTFFYQG